MVKYLVIRFSSIGDIILTTPVVRHLKTQVEDSEVHFLTKNSYVSMLRANPYIDAIHPFEGNLNETLQSLEKFGFDYIIDLHNNFRSARIKFRLKRMDFTVKKLNVKKWLMVNFKLNLLPPDDHMVKRNLDTIRMFISEEDQHGLDYFIPEDEEVGKDQIPVEFHKGFIAVAIGAKHQTKKLPVEMLTSLCNQLDYPVILLGGKEDFHAGDQIVKALQNRNCWNTCGTFSINQSASVIRQSRVLITHDTGMMHVGAAFRKRMITVWGNTVPEFGMYAYQPDPRSLNMEVNDLKCRPCSKLGYASCPKKHFKCMREHDPVKIAGEANRLFHIP